MNEANSRLDYKEYYGIPGTKTTVHGDEYSTGSVKDTVEKTYFYLL